jgi:hypothetical protein
VEKKTVPNYDYELVWYIVQIHMYKPTNLKDEKRLAFRCVIYTDIWGVQSIVELKKQDSAALASPVLQSLCQ